MRVLKSVQPSREQLPLVSNDRPGVAVIRGAAGSGKTTTALLRLKQLCAQRRSRRIRLGETEPVKVLVLTFNRSLAGYVQALAKEQVTAGADLKLTVSTFASWAASLTRLEMLENSDVEFLVSQYGKPLGLTDRFLFSEVEYALGRFEPASLQEYLTRDREGRGTAPRVDKKRLYEEVLLPYSNYKQQHSLNDWNDLAIHAAATQSEGYDIIVVDEAQDFSANQVRAVLQHAKPDASVTFILDTVQRIYPRFYTWRELGLDASKFVLNARLQENQRNTKEIAAFARPFVEGLVIDDNGELPDFTSATESGALPQVFRGKFRAQAQAILRYLDEKVDLDTESVGILHPKGRGWFRFLEEQLDDHNVPYVMLSRQRAWPDGPQNVGLSTLHSAKGLEFDHVAICGLTGETADASRDDENTEWQNTRRLFAMAIGRARTGLLVCHDPAKPSPILEVMQEGTYEDFLPGRSI